MNRVARVGLASALFLFAAGCAGDDGGQAQPIVAEGVSSGGVALPATAQGEASNPAPGILVTGIGEVRGRPDTLTLSLGVSVTRKTVSDASADAARAAEKVLAALTDNGVAREDLQTRNYSIYPQYATPTSPDTTMRITGYTVSNVVVVKIRDIAKAGTIIDAAAVAGGDEVVVQGVAFSLEDSAALLGQARQRAWLDAKTKADELSKLAGVTLGTPVQIVETTSGSTQPVTAATEAARSATPVEAGQVTTSVQLTVRFTVAG